TQGKACNDVSPVRYWMHANMLTINRQRMSKSSGNYSLPMQLITGENTFFEKALSPSLLRLCSLQAQYRCVIDISYAAMLASETVDYVRKYVFLKTFFSKCTSFLFFTGTL